MATVRRAIQPSEVVKILAVDDEESGLHSLKRLFWDDDSVEMECVSSGKQALERVASFQPDVVVLDVLMPGIDGYEVCRRIKSDEKTAGTMVLFLSARADLDARIEGYGVEADDYITKPYEPEELKAKVYILLRLKKAQDDLKDVNLNLEAMVQERTKALVRKSRQALIGQMLQGIVHNMKNPLSGIKGYIQLAGMTCEEDSNKADTIDNWKQSREKINDYLKVAATAVDSLESLIGNLLAKSRSDVDIEKTAVNLNHVITQEMVFFEADLYFKHQVDKNIDLDPRLPTISGVQADFSQIFGNLLQNAVDAMKGRARARIDITTTHDEQYVFLSIRDTGTGIDTKDAELIFEPFFTTKRNVSEAGESVVSGTGLGLHTCANIIRTYGGEIKVESTVGKGTRFLVCIPYA